MRKLSLIGNELTNLPSNIDELTNLSELYLNENDITAFPENFCKLVSLRILNVVGNKLKRLPDSFGSLFMLKHIIAEENNLVCLPSSFCDLINLEVLELNTNKLSDLPYNFGRLAKLKVLNISQNKIQEFLPETFGKLKHVEVLDISNNYIKFLPEEFASHKRLRKFYCDCNLVQVLPEWVGDMPEIVEFRMSDNKLQAAPIPETFGKVSKKLKVFHFGGNFIARLPDSICDLECVEYFHIGSVIDEIERRAFQNGNWIPQLPQDIGRLRNLKRMRLDENQLTELPDSFGDLVSLEFFDIGESNMVLR